MVQIYEDLAWLGLSWETPVLRQANEFDTYRNALNWLEKLGVLYPCFATRSEIAEAAKGNPDALDPDGAPLYPGLHKRLSESQVTARRDRGEPFALRLDMERALVAVRGMLAMSLCRSSSWTTKENRNASRRIPSAGAMP